MKVSFFLLFTLAMLSCTAVCDKQEGDLTMEDPEPRGLVSYQPLEITFHREIMPDYDRWQGVRRDGNIFYPGTHILKTRLLRYCFKHYAEWIKASSN